MPISAKTTPVLPAPTPKLANYYLAEWDKHKDYCSQENALDRLFMEICPENNNISGILLKVSVLNDFYSTNIFKTYPVATHILALGIDERLQSGDITLVDDIKKVEIGGKTRNFYSFATKYCSHHRPLDYPIYDSYIDRLLRYYRNEDHFVAFKNDDLKNYVCFKQIIEEFRYFYRLDKYNFKELDKYLWQFSKDKFGMHG